MLQSRDHIKCQYCKRDWATEYKFWLCGVTVGENAFFPLMVFYIFWQVCMEGEISRQSIMNSLSRGKKASGDLIPWTISEQVNNLSVCSPKMYSSTISYFQSAHLCSLNWLLSLMQFQDPDFGGLSGGRVVRIAVHPDYQGVKYFGTQLLWIVSSGTTRMAVQAHFKNRANITIAPAFSILSLGTEPPVVIEWSQVQRNGLMPQQAGGHCFPLDG